MAYPVNGNINSFRKLAPHFCWEYARHSTISIISPCVMVLSKFYVLRIIHFLSFTGIIFFIHVCAQGWISWKMICGHLSLGQADLQEYYVLSGACLNYSSMSGPSRFQTESSSSWHCHCHLEIEPLKRLHSTGTLTYVTMWESSSTWLETEG